MMGLGLLVPVLIVVALVYALGWRPQDRRPPQGQFDEGREPEKTSLDIVKERYARGEITKEQYEEMRRELTV